MDDDELSSKAGIQPRQQVNQLCRQLEASGLIRRFVGAESKLVSELTESGATYATASQPGAALDQGETSVRSGTRRVSDGTAVPFGEARQYWADEARVALIEIAGTYNAFTTYAELAERVQQESGIRTRMQMRNWIGKVLALVVEDCQRRGEPALTSLCVRQDGSVGEGYGYVLEQAGQPVPDDLDLHAANARLDC